MSRSALTCAARRLSFVEGAVGAGCGWFVEADLRAGTDGQVSHGLGDVGLPDADGAVVFDVTGFAAALDALDHGNVRGRAILVP